MKDIIPHFFYGPLILTIALLFYLFPPNRINGVYGYRSAQSMKNEQTWKAANEFSSRSLLIGSVILLGFQILAWYKFKPYDMLASTIVLVVILFGIIYLTERKLKAEFDKEGNKRSELHNLK
jgi:uncharacterized membrane protein